MYLIVVILTGKTQKGRLECGNNATKKVNLKEICKKEKNEDFRLVKKGHHILAKLCKVVNLQRRNLVS